MTTLASPSCLSRGSKPPAYDLDLEVLATIPTADACDIRMLAQDFRMPLFDMRDILNRLALAYGIGIALDSVVVPRRAREAVNAECLAYWTAVYETDVN